ncbi:MAG TPA: hypothetical protein VNG29_01120, partial [Candidatus Paceibacterota bacterium]|nr:hypothetical protein [Candidatus Paceibacterota bacterium]
MFARGAAICAIALVFFAIAPNAFAQSGVGSLPTTPVSPSIVGLQPALPTAPATTPNNTANQSLLQCALNSGGNLITCLLFGITTFIVSVITLFVQVGAWLTQLALNFNDTIVNSPIVQSGWSVALSIANLGFVLGIIVIAIATILRNETYGVKQMLWKLIVAAIMVNFSLVIGGVIINFAGQMTTYFMAPFPAGAGVTCTVSGCANQAFVTNLTNAFNPNKFNLPPATAASSATGAGSSGGSSAWNTFINLAYQAAKVISLVQFGGIGLQNANTAISSTFMAIFGMIFSIAFTSVIAFTFLALAVLLMIRYVYLSFLLILAPFAWLLWIFPGFSGNFRKWWQLFIRWSFFPVITVFFLYLAILTQANNGAYAGNAAAAGATGSNAALAGIVAQTGASPSTFQAIPGELVVLALAIGGLFAANSLSITGANVALGMVKSAGTAVQGYAG